VGGITAGQHRGSERKRIRSDDSKADDCRRCGRSPAGRAL